MWTKVPHGARQSEYLLAIAQLRRAMRGHVARELTEAVGFSGPPRTRERLGLMRAAATPPVTLGKARRGSLARFRAELSIRTSQRLLQRHTRGAGRVRVD